MKPSAQSADHLDIAMGRALVVAIYVCGAAFVFHGLCDLFAYTGERTESNCYKFHHPEEAKP